MSAERSFLNTTVGSTADARHNDSTLHQSRLLFGDDNDILLQVCQDIFMDFHVFCRQGGDFLDIVGNFREAASDGVKIFEHAFDGRQKVHPQINNVLEAIKCERNTYDLIAKLYQSEQIAYNDEETRSDLKRLFRQNEEFRRLVTLLHWSEEVAFESPVGFSQLVDECMKLETLEHAFGEAAHNREFAHPDSVYQNTLTPNDKANLDRIKRIFFCLLRCGRVRHMDELVNKVGLASMKTFIQIREVLSNPDRTPADSLNNGYEFAEARLHFKNMASLILNIADETITVNDQCIWAALSGNLSILLAHAEQPEDILWAYLNCGVETILDDEIVTTHSIENDDIIEAVESREDVPQSVDEAFAGLLTHFDSPYFRIVGALATNSFDLVVDLINADIRTWDQPDPIKLRLYTHLVLLIKASESGYDKTKADEVILAYVKLLSELGLILLVPYYVSKTEMIEPVEVMTEFLFQLTAEADRIKALQAAAEVNFDIGVLCNMVYGKAKAQHQIGDNDNIADSIAILMDSWKFLLISPEHTSFEALIECNNLLRKLFARDRLAEAMELLAIAPCNLTVLTDDFLKRIKAEPSSPKNERFMRQIMDQQREHNSYLLYLEIMEKFTMWRGNMNKKLPGRPISVSDVDYSKFDVIQRADYEKRHAASREQMSEHIKKCNETKQLAVNQILDLYNQTTTWLISCLQPEDISNNEEHIARVQELEIVHERYLYYTVTMLITLHRESRNEQDVVSVANLLMNSRFDLYSHLSKESLRKILSEISKSGHVLAVNEDE